MAGKKRIAPSVFEVVNKTTKEHWRAVADKSKLHVYYATGPGLLATNKPLRELAATGSRGQEMVSKYSNYLIEFLRGQGYPDFNTQNLVKQRNRELGVYDWSDPADKTGVAIVATQTGTGTGFAKIKDIANIAHKNAQAAMKMDYPGEWNDFEVDPGHLARHDQPGITPALLRAQEAKNIIEPRSFARIHRTTSSGATTKAKILNEIDHTIGSTINAHTDNSVKYTRNFDPSGIMGGKVSIVIIVQHDKQTNQEVLNKFESNLGSTVSARMRGVKVSRLEGSPSFVDIFLGAISNIFKGIKNRRVSYSNTERDKRRKLVEKRQVKRTDLSSRISLKTPKVVKPKVGVSMFAMRNLINEVLSEHVKREMGKATDPAIKLRYQTGRFADSAVLLTLNRTQAGILAGTYSYMRNPYDTFLPGGRLGTAARNPKIYLESGIRNAALAILKRDFPGLSLDLT